jgi:hypothetical protein
VERILAVWQSGLAVSVAGSEAAMKQMREGWKKGGREETDGNDGKSEVNGREGRKRTLTAAAEAVGNLDIKLNS